MMLTKLEFLSRARLDQETLEVCMSEAWLLHRDRSGTR